VTSDQNREWPLAVLRRLRSSPAHFLGRNDVRTLEVYLAGYEQARRDLGASCGWAIFDEFYAWLSVTLANTTTLGWVGLVELEDSSEDNVRTFFRRFDEFLAATARSC